MIKKVRANNAGILMEGLKLELIIKPWLLQWEFEIITIKFGINFKIHTGVAEVH